jgi:hypothetical protein
MRVETLAEQLFFVTCRIEAHSRTAAWTGTGFVYAVETDRGPAHFLVTNKHVLENPETGPAEEMTLRFVQGQVANPIPTQIALGQATQVTIKGLNPDMWVGHPDRSVDVACFPMSPVLEDMARRGVPAFFRAVSPEMCLGVGADVDTDAIESLVFIGYPNGLFDTANFLPILRRGTTATPLEVDYRGKPAFLMDASVFPGSSGSPVFILDRGIYVTRGGATVVGSRIACVGIVAAVHTRRVDGEVQQVDTSLVAEFREPIDLGIVYKAVAIDRCVQLLLDRAGLSRKAGGDEVVPVDGPSAADDALGQELPV